MPSIGAAAVPADAYLLDVREQEEWTAGHAPDAVHLPLGYLPARLAEVPQDREVVVVCRVGNRSALATAFLTAQGRRAVNLDGGMLDWATAGRPMVSETGQDPHVV